MKRASYILPHPQFQLKPYIWRRLRICQCSTSNSNGSAVLDKSTSFAMSGAGWLWPFYVGCMEVMKAHGYLTNKSIVAGTSGGSIAALIACCDVLSSKEILKISVNMGTNRNFMNNIDAGLKSTIRSLLPHDALQRCNGRLHIVTTKLWPAPTLTPTVISTFCDEEMLIDAVAASCFIPLYSARRLYTHIHGFGKSQFIDGGVLAFMPPIGDVKISPFKQGLLRRQVPATIYLDQLVYSRPRLVVYSLKPDPKVMMDLYERGKDSAEKWIEKQEKMLRTQEKP